MNNYHFTLFIDLQDLDVTDPDAIILLSNRIFEAGCDDGIVTGSSDGEGVAFQIEFDREARSFEEAVSTAIQDLSRVHLTATLVE